MFKYYYVWNVKTLAIIGISHTTIETYKTGNFGYQENNKILKLYKIFYLALLDS